MKTQYSENGSSTLGTTCSPSSSSKEAHAQKEVTEKVPLDSF